MVGRQLAALDPNETDKQEVRVGNKASRIRRRDRGRRRRNPRQIREIYDTMMLMICIDRNMINKQIKYKELTA